MTELSIALWGRQLKLDVVFDRYEGEDILGIQKDALEAIQEKWKEVERSLTPLIEYCLKRDGGEIGSSGISNIFKYVMPKSLYVMRTSKKRSIALMCNYRFDPEHGIALVFENEKYKRVCSQDDVL